MFTFVCYPSIAQRGDSFTTASLPMLTLVRDWTITRSYHKGKLWWNEIAVRYLRGCSFLRTGCQDRKYSLSFVFCGLSVKIGNLIVSEVSFAEVFFSFSLHLDVTLRVVTTGSPPPLQVAKMWLVKEKVTEILVSICSYIVRLKIPPGIWNIYSFSCNLANLSNVYVT